MATDTAPHLFLSPEEAGRLLGCSSQAVRDMVRRGDLRAEMRGRNFKIPRVEVEKRAGLKLGPTEEDRERSVKLKELRQTLAKAQALLAELE